MAQGNTDTMAERMISLTREPSPAARMGRRAREHVAAHDSTEQSLATPWVILEKAAASRVAERGPGPA